MNYTISLAYTYFQVMPAIVCIQQYQIQPDKKSWWGPDSTYREGVIVMLQ